MTNYWIPAIGALVVIGGGYLLIRSAQDNTAQQLALQAMQPQQGAGTFQDVLTGLNTFASIGNTFATAISNQNRANSQNVSGSSSTSTPTGQFDLTQTSRNDSVWQQYAPH